MLNGRASSLPLSAAMNGCIVVETDPLQPEDATDEEIAAIMRAARLMVEALDNDNE